MSLQWPEMPKMTPQLEAERYENVWEDYRRAAARYWLPFVTYIPGVLIFGWLLSLVAGDNAGHGIVAFAWAVWWFVWGRDYTNFRCPRCGNKFFYNKVSRFSTNLTSRCLNCGLLKFAVNREGDVPEDPY